MTTQEKFSDCFDEDTTDIMLVVLWKNVQKIETGTFLHLKKERKIIRNFWISPREAIKLHPFGTSVE